jgi:hypothetical protein
MDLSEVIQFRRAETRHGRPRAKGDDPGVERGHVLVQRLVVRADRLAAGEPARQDDEKYVLTRPGRLQ